MLNPPRPKTPRVQQFGGDRRSTAALEFALIAPILILLFFGVYDISDAMLTYQEVFTAARTIAASASNISVQGSNGATKLYYGQVQLEASGIFADMPTVRDGFHVGIKSITISSIDFEVAANQTSCTLGVSCNYNAYVVWSAAYAGPPSPAAASFTPALRSCATETISNGVATLNAASALSQVGPSAGAPGDLTTIRTAKVTTPDVYPAPPDPIIVVDVHYQYVPVFNLFIKKPVDFWANGYWPLRSVQATQLTDVNGTETFTAVATDQQFTGLVATGTTAANGATTYAINASNVYPSALTGQAPPGTDYCISPYYTEPSS